MKKTALLVVYFVAATSASLFAQTQAEKNCDFFANEPQDVPTIFAPGIVSLPNELEADLIISPNGDEIFYVSGEWPNTTIMHSTKTAQGWTAPAIAPFATKGRTTEPTFSADGKWVYFSSSEGKENKYRYNLWRAKKTADGWQKPESLFDIGADSTWEFHPSITANGELYFCTWNSKTQTGDIYMSRCTDQGCSQATRVNLNIAPKYSLSDPYISYDGSYIIYSTNIPGGFGNYDQYISYRTPDGKWSAPKNIGPKFNTAEADADMDISPDGQYIITHKKGDIFLQRNTLTNRK